MAVSQQQRISDLLSALCESYTHGKGNLTCKLTQDALLSVCSILRTVTIICGLASIISKLNQIKVIPMQVTEGV